MFARSAAVLLLVVTLVTSGCGSNRSESSTELIAKGHFATPMAIANELKSKGFKLRDCDAQAHPTVISDSSIRCVHTPDGTSDAVVFDIYSSAQQENEARDYLAKLGYWAETLYGDGWSVSSANRQTAKQVRAILGAGAEP